MTFVETLTINYNVVLFMQACGVMIDRKSKKVLKTCASACSPRCDSKTCTFCCNTPNCNEGMHCSILLKRFYSIVFFRRCMAERLPIQRKTLYIQSINLLFFYHCRMVSVLGCKTYTKELLLCVILNCKFDKFQNMEHTAHGLIGNRKL